MSQIAFGALHWPFEVHPPAPVLALVELEAAFVELAAAPPPPVDPLELLDEALTAADELEAVEAALEDADLELEAVAPPVPLSDALPPLPPAPLPNG